MLCPRATFLVSLKIKYQVQYVLYMWESMYELILTVVKIVTPDFNDINVP
jgi:hypothetical protein